MQENFSQGANFIPAHPDVALPKLYTQNKQSLFWSGWDDFLRMN